MWDCCSLKYKLGFPVGCPLAYCLKSANFVVCLPDACCSTVASSHLCNFLSVQVSDRGLSYLQGLVQLKKLALQGTGVTSTSMPIVGTFSELQALDIAWTAIDSQGMLVTLLESLHLCGTIKLLGGYLHNPDPKLQNINFV